MISAVDTNILLDVLRPNPDFVESSTRLLESSAELGSTLICPIVYSELSAHFKEEGELKRFLEDCTMQIDNISQEVAFAAGQTWRAYRAAGGKRKRIVSDFIIGAHATIQASRLLSRDRGFYLSYFPNLSVLSEHH